MAKRVGIHKLKQTAPGKNFKRMDLAAQSFGVSVSFLKKLIGEGKLTRYKLGAATMIDLVELEKLVVVDPGDQNNAGHFGQTARANA